jgi:A/G-specific adenine glycosylase
MARTARTSSYLYAPTLAPEVITQVQQGLLTWYASAGRDLPWRKTHDPYAILVSEVMLQQTQVDRVLPKFQQFLAAFPTLADLAVAPTADVIEIWAGLGYNRRAISLQTIARQAQIEFAGTLPETVEDLLKLKGVGRYTAGALAIFAYQQQIVTVDTNIFRVLHRVFIGLELPVPRLNTESMFTFAEQVLPPGDAYNWHQALMDLGATICTSNNPTCSSCPLCSNCRAYQEMGQHSLFPGGDVVRELRKVAEKKAPYESFVGSNRYFRGRVIAHLRTQPANSRVSLDELGPTLKENYQPADLPWLHKLLTGLQRDGLVDLSEEGVRLP